MNQSGFGLPEVVRRGAGRTAELARHVRDASLAGNLVVADMHGRVERLRLPVGQCSPRRLVVLADLLYSSSDLSREPVENAAERARLADDRKAKFAVGSVLERRNDDEARIVERRFEPPEVLGRSFADEQVERPVLDYDLTPVDDGS